MTTKIVYCDIQKFNDESKTKKWWDEARNKSENKWRTLRQNGPQFPPPYEPLPSNIKILYDGQSIKLSNNTKNEFNVSAEEAAVFYAQRLNQDERLAEEDAKRKQSKDDKKFVSNFWNDWKVILKKDHPMIKDFSKVDFRPIQKYLLERSALKEQKRKAMTKEEKQAEKEEKEAIKQLYNFAVIDGNKIPIAGNIIQPPGLYFGHGEQPFRGRIKKRMMPSDITINVSFTHVPRCKIDGVPCKWGGVVENKDALWLSSWIHPITGKRQQINLSRNESQFTCSNDMEKFEKARKLGKNIAKIRKNYEADMKSTKPDTKQLATAVYLLDKLAIRPGVDKDESKEAGTLGLTTLKCANVEFKANNKIKFDFIGKSSIEFVKEFTVPKQVYDNMKALCGSSKSKNKELFPNVTADTLNDYLKTLLDGLTAKVFRTYKASSILQEKLDETEIDKNMPVHEKKIEYNKVNIEVAKALNHKKMGQSNRSVEVWEKKLEDAKEKLENATTDKQKTAAKKSIGIAESKLEELQENISTATSKVNYMDPRITVTWCKLNEMPIEKIYNKTQLHKFVWAMETDSKWKF